MKIVYDFPPNYAEIEAAFGSLRGRGVLFCYGDSIYALDGQKVSPALIAHESVHSARQGSNPATWWQKYISDVTFRYNEEVAAHIAEYSWHLQNSSGRNDRRKWLAIVSARLTQPLYRFGPLVTKAKAKDALRAGYEACVTQANATTNFEARKKLAEWANRGGDPWDHPSGNMKKFFAQVVGNPDAAVDESHGRERN